jgi:hypothetical protein
MTERFVLATVAVVVAWWVRDFVIHGLILRSTREATASSWRPMAEMKRGLMSLVTLVGAGAFVGLYGALVNPRSLSAGVKYGLLFSVAVGFPMGFGTYCVMPVPAQLVVAWFLGTVAGMLVAGAIVGAVVRVAAASPGSSTGS